MAAAVLSGVRDFTVPRASHFGQLVGHVVFTIPALASAALYTSCDLMTLGTHDYFTKSIKYDLLAVPKALKSLSEKSKSAQERIDESVRHIVYSFIRTVNPAASIDLWYPQYSPEPQTQKLLKQLGDSYLAHDRTSAGRLVPRYCPTRIFNWVLTQQLKSNDYYLNGSRLNVRARLFSLTSGVALAIVGIACVIFGALATIVAIFAAPFDRFNEINTYAVNLTGMIGFSVNQLHQGVIGFFRPSHLVTPGLLKKKP